MISKLTVALTKKEAEIYFAQGLHKEAMVLYEGLLNSASGLPESIRDSIRQRMAGIALAIESADVDPSSRMTEEELQTLRSGWGSHTNRRDHLICGGALCQIGCYEEALREFSFLLEKRFPALLLIDPIMECLARLNSESTIAASIDTFFSNHTSAKSIGSGLLQRCAIELEEKGFTSHSVALWQKLASQNPDQPRWAQHIERISALRPAVPPPPPGKQPLPLPETLSAADRLHRCLRDAVELLKRAGRWAASRSLPMAGRPASERPATESKPRYR
ncbi:MAG: hypothetical protein PVF20_06575 [Desulfobacterales bacterium]|jgi:hypothetical protein